MKRKHFKNLLEQRVFFLDGASGTEFFKRGYEGKLAEILNLTRAEDVMKLHRDYLEAGADIILTNTFNANRAKLKQFQLEEQLEKINVKAVTIARQAAGEQCLIFGDIGPTGHLLEPFGELSFKTAYEIFREQAMVLAESGVDGLILETFSDIKELKAAILAIRDALPDMPIIAQMTFNQEGKTITGTSVEIFATLINDLEIEAAGINCYLTPEQMIPIFGELANNCQLPLSVEPNGGQPDLSSGALSYRLKPEEFALYANELVKLGANLIGGCCGIGPEHLKAAVRLIGKCPPVKRASRIKQFLTSRTIIKPIEPFLIIGEKINASARKKLQPLIQNMDFTEILTLARSQEDEGADVLDINPGIEKLLTPEHIRKLIMLLDRYSTLPLSLDILEDELLVVALEEYAGRPLINSATACENNLRSRLNILKRFGGMLIVLAMEDKIPDSAEQRFKIIEKAYQIISEYGIDTNRIFFDPLVLPQGTGHDYRVTLKTLQLITGRGWASVIGLSNLSYGLPDREKINAAFLALAVNSGLKASIMNTSEKVTSQILEGVLILTGRQKTGPILNLEEPIQNFLLKGKKEELLEFLKESLKQKSTLEIAQEILAPAMEKIGSLYAENKIFLPQLLLAAETAISGFNFLNSQMKIPSTSQKGLILLATVEGDIHDIGKNIVATVLKSSGFSVRDIGKNVPPRAILQACQKFKPDILGLSAMMTTTVGKIEETANLLRSYRLNLPIIAGGASMNRELARRFGVLYAKDAVEALKICQKLISKKEEKHETN